MGTGGSKFITFDNVAAGATAHGWWNNAKAEMYRLSAWPKVAPGILASAEITQIRSIVHGNPSERELHFWVKNTGTTTIDIDVWGFWWDWALKPVLEDIRSEFNVPAVGGATVTNQGVVVLDVAGRRKHGDPTAVAPGDKWHLGSDTKAMTATLLGVLIQKGAAGGLSWNSTCADAFPEWAQSMKSLKNCTFQQLMAHRSGITDVSSAEGTALGDTSKTIVQRRRNFAKLVVERQAWNARRGLQLPELELHPGRGHVRKVHWEVVGRHDEIKLSSRSACRPRVSVRRGAPAMWTNPGATATRPGNE